MNYDEYCDLFGPPSPLFKFVPLHADRRRILSKTYHCSISNLLNLWIPMPLSFPSSFLLPLLSAVRRWRPFSRLTVARTSLKISKDRPGETSSTRSKSQGTFLQLMMNPTRQNVLGFACALKATTRSISSLTSSNASLKSNNGLIQREEETEDGRVSRSYLNYHFFQ